jgi:hypothetical protein
VIAQLGCRAIVEELNCTFGGALQIVSFYVAAWRIFLKQVVGNLSFVLVLLELES